MRLDKIYTRSGDDGTTSLGDGKRVPKFDPRVEAYGTVDEANAQIGVGILYVKDSEIRELLARIQNDLFDVGADLSKPQNVTGSSLRLSSTQVTWIEEQIDFYNSQLDPLNSFVLPGGSEASAHLHVARTVVRRAERSVAQLAATQPINLILSEYLNRLSDLLFVLGRFVNDHGHADVTWRPGLNQVSKDRPR